MEKIKEMESQREFSIQTERANQLDEDDKTYNRIMVGGLKEPIASNQNQSFVNLTYFLINISKNIYRRMPNYGSF